MRLSKRILNAMILAVAALAFAALGAHAGCDEGDPDCPPTPPQSRQVSISTASGQEVDREDLFDQTIEPVPFSMPLPDKLSPVNTMVSVNQAAQPDLNTIEVGLRRQSPSDVSCGIQALGMALEPLRSTAPSSNAILDFLQSNDYLYEFGTGVEELAFAAQSFGYEGSVAFHNWDLEDLRGELDAGHPVVIDLGENGSGQPGHFVTLTGISRDWQWVSYSDPILGERTVALADFMRLWDLQGRSGVAVASAPPPSGSPGFAAWSALAAATMATLALGSNVLQDLRRRGAGGQISSGTTARTVSDPPASPAEEPEPRPHDPPPPQHAVAVKIPVVEQEVVGERVIGGHWEEQKEYVKPYWDTISPGHWEWQERQVAYTAYRPKSILVQKIVNVVRKVTEKVTTWVKTKVVKPVTEWVKKTVWEPVTKWVKKTKTWFAQTWLGKWIRKSRTWFEKKVSWVKKTVWKPVKRWVTQEVLKPVTSFVTRTIVEPVKKWVQETIMEPYTAYRTEKVEVFTPPVKRHVPGHYETKRVWVEETVPVMQQVVRYEDAYVDAGDLPDWVAVDFFKQLDPSLNRDERMALFNKFRDTFNRFFAADPGNAERLYDMALEIFHQSISPVEDASAMQSWKMVGTWALSLRADAGSDSDVLTYFEYGQYLRLTDETKQVGGSTWYKVQCLKDGQLVEGWITGTYLTDYVQGSSKAMLGEQMEDIFEEHGVELQGTWSLRDERAAAVAIDDVAESFARSLGIDKDEAFRMVFDQLNLLWGVEPESGYLTPECSGIGTGGCTSSSSMINFGSLWNTGSSRPEDVAFQASVNNVVHELGHAFANLWWGTEEGPYADLGSAENKSLLTNLGFGEGPPGATGMWRQHYEEVPTPNEVFADMFLGWIYGEWLEGQEGNERLEYMDENMPEWLKDAVGDE